MEKGIETLKLPSGKVVLYKNYITAGLYLDLQDIPEHLAGTRIRHVAKTLIQSIDGDDKKENIGKIFEEMSIQDMNELSIKLQKVIEASGDKKKSSTEVPESVSGKREGDAGDSDN